jgi:hypothetical protein
MSVLLVGDMRKMPSLLVVPETSPPVSDDWKSTWPLLLTRCCVVLRFMLELNDAPAVPGARPRVACPRWATMERPPAGPVQKAVLFVVVAPLPLRLDDTKMVPLGVITALLTRPAPLVVVLWTQLLGLGSVGPLSGLPIVSAAPVWPSRASNCMLPGVP